jgi:hypothetical protein
MKSIHTFLIGTVSLALVAAGGGEASAQDQYQYSNQKKLRRDRMKIALDAGGMALGAGGFVLGAATFNPVLVGFGTASFGASTGALGVHTYRYVKDKNAGQGTATARTNDAQVESLVAVPGRPGYWYYPSNPNQLYFDGNAAAASEPAQVTITRPAPIHVMIANAARNGRTVRYTVSGTPFEIPPGYIQVLTAPTGSIIAFDRGDVAGVARFTLNSGAYDFRTVEQSWRFYSTPPRASLANAKPSVVAGSSEATKPATVMR